MVKKDSLETYNRFKSCWTAKNFGTTANLYVPRSEIENVDMIETKASDIIKTPRDTDAEYVLPDNFDELRFE